MSSSGDHARWDPATQGVGRIRVGGVTVDVMPVDVMAALWTRSCDGFLYLVKGIAHIRSDAYSRQQVPGGLTRDSFPRWAGLRGGSR
jgi:hypothetical protein